MKKIYSLLMFVAQLGIAQLLIAQCPTELTFTQGPECGDINFSLNELMPNQSVTWFFQDPNAFNALGNSIQFHHYDNPGTYNVCAHIASNEVCPESYEICTTVIIENCFPAICPETIDVVPSGYCFEIGFQIGTGTNELAEVTWFMDDAAPIEFGDFIWYGWNESEIGMHSVCAFYTSPQCPAGTELCLDYDLNCNETPICPETIYYSEGVNCGTYNFALQTDASNASIIWYPGDESGAVTGGSTFEHHYELPGTYNVCVSYSSPLCPDGTEFCTTITVPNCTENICPTSISADQADCDSFVFHVNSESNGNVFWNFGDGATETSGINADHTFAENGVYIVTAAYSGPNCPGTTISYTVVVECPTNTECPTEITATVGVLCGNMIFSVGVPNSGADVTWFPGDGTGPIAGGSVFDHHYTEPGTYEVCAFYTNAFCTAGVELCTTIEVANCTENICPTAITTDQINCDTYVFHVVSETDGNVFWNFGDGITVSGGITSDHIFNSNGVYVVSAAFSGPNCTGTTIYYTVVVDCASGYDCPTSIAYNFGADCGVVNFEIGSFTEGESVVWYPGDETGPIEGGHFLSHTYASPGTYQVCALYTSNACPNQVELCTAIVVEPCGEEICPTAININAEGCHQFVFTVNEFGSSNFGDINWNFGDGLAYGQNHFLHFYQEVGAYDVCAYGTTPSCPSGFELCTDVFVEACGGDGNGDGCPDFIWGNPINDCGLWHFEAGPNYNTILSTVWDFGDGTSSDNGTIVNHEYLADGVYIVTLTFTSVSCPDPITLSYTVEANYCEESPCAQEIAVLLTEECGTVNFEVGSFVEGENFEWSFGDGTSVSGGHFISHHYSEPGVYTVECSYSNSLCTFNQLFTVVVIESCEPCNQLTFGLDSYVSQGGSPSVVFSITDINYTTSYYFGQATYTAEDPYYDIDVCLPDGCYILTVDNNYPITYGENIFAFLNVDGINVMENATILNQDNISFSAVFGIHNDCTETPSCSASFTPLYTNTPGHVEFINTSTFNGTAAYSWDYGNGTTSDGQGGNVWYEQNGIYEVCLTITTDNCEDSYCLSVVVNDMETACEANELTVVITAENPLELTELIQLGYSVDGLDVGSFPIAIVPNFSSTFTMCVPNGCYEFNFSSELPTALEMVQAEFILNGESVDVLQLIQNTSSSSVVFGLNSDCVDNVSESEQNQWMIYPNPAKDILHVQSSNGTEILQVDLFDALGQLVFSHSPSHTTAYSHDLSKLENGLYFIKITEENSSAIQRVEIIH